LVDNFSILDTSYCIYPLGSIQEKNVSLIACE
jgi:hypothetical protein